MRKGSLLLALSALLLASLAWAAPVEKPALNEQIAQKGVAMGLLGSRLTLVEESFETAVPPAGWTTMTTGNSFSWMQSTSLANTGAASAYVPYGPIGAWQDEWLVTPALDATTMSTVTLEFAENEAYWASWGLEHNIMVSTTVPDDPAAFTDVLTMTPANHSIVGWTMVSVDLTAYAGMDNIYIAFRYQGDYADNWYIDDVRVFEPFEHDVKVSGVTPSGDIAFPGVEFAPQVMVKNVGSNPESFPVHLMIDHDGMMILDETLNVADLAVGAETMLDFSAFTTMSGNYVLTATTMLEGDMDPANDTGAGLVICWTEERTPFGILYTEWGCGPCVSANQALDAWYPTQGNDVTLMRVHVWWPAGTDPIYHANEEQAEYLHGMCPTTVNGVPTLYLDNLDDAWDLDWNTWQEGIDTIYGMSEARPAPMGVDLGYNTETGNVEVMVNVVNGLMPEGDYRLFVGITEDGVAALGPNGEPIHNQAFRHLFPGVEGLAINPVPGVDVYQVPVELDPCWAYENLRATAWVQEYPGGMVLNAGTIFLTEGTVGIDDDFVDNDIDENNTPALVTRVTGAHPNPFNPMTTVKFSVARTQHVTLAVYNLSGQRVATLADGTYEAGEHPVQWNGTDLNGRGVSSGTYIVHMQSDDGVSASKIQLVR